MIITIRKEHCIGRLYCDILNCPLAAAIREQAPDFPLECVGGYSLNTSDGQEYQFDSSKWNEDVMKAILSGERGPLTLNILIN